MLFQLAGLAVWLVAWTIARSKHKISNGTWVWIFIFMFMGTANAVMRDEITNINHRAIQIIAECSQDVKAHGCRIALERQKEYWEYREKMDRSWFLKYNSGVFLAPDADDVCVFSVEDGKLKASCPTE